MLYGGSAAHRCGIGAADAATYAAALVEIGCDAVEVRSTLASTSSIKLVDCTQGDTYAHVIAGWDRGG
jgi:hypothetical protein